MNAQEMNNFKQVLNEKRNEVLNRIISISHDKQREAGAINPDSQEQAVDVQNDEVIDSLDLIERNELNSIDLALKRIESGEFGKCIQCDEDIPLKRLQAIPYSVECINCHQD